jgi:hypothetical protein
MLAGIIALPAAISAPTNSFKSYPFFLIFQKGVRFRAQTMSLFVFLVVIFDHVKKKLNPISH